MVCLYAERSWIFVKGNNAINSELIGHKYMMLRYMLSIILPNSARKVRSVVLELTVGSRRVRVEMNAPTMSSVSKERRA